MNSFPNKTSLEQALANAIAEALKEAISTHGDARMLVSGGTTPWGMYEALSQMELDWSSVTIGLVDERFVPLNSKFSNEASIRSCLLLNKAAKAKLIGMVPDASDYTKNLALVRNHYLLFSDRTDVAVLGMGEDGHTASLFPTDPASLAILQSNEKGVFNTTAPSVPTERITVSAQVLKDTKACYLMLVGAKKRTVFNEAAAQHYPIAAFIQHPSFNVYYSE